MAHNDGESLFHDEMAREGRRGADPCAALLTWTRRARTQEVSAEWEALDDCTMPPVITFKADGMEGFDRAELNFNKRAGPHPRHDRECGRPDVGCVPSGALYAHPVRFPALHRRPAPVCSRHTASLNRGRGVGDDAPGRNPDHGHDGGLTARGARQPIAWRGWCRTYHRQGGNRCSRKRLNSLGLGPRIPVLSSSLGG